VSAGTQRITASERRWERSRSPGEPRMSRFNHRGRSERKVETRTGMFMEPRREAASWVVVFVAGCGVVVAVARAPPP